MTQSTREPRMSGYTVKALIAELQKYPQDALVVLAADEEGNDFGVLWHIEKDESGVPVMYPASGTVESL